ncbi:MAG: hypothetical protein AMXMBFR36_35990 [Acidobacteriota bacterium]
MGDPGRVWSDGESAGEEGQELPATAAVICEAAVREVRRLRGGDERAREIAQVVVHRFLAKCPRLENPSAWSRVSARRELRDVRRRSERFESLTATTEPASDGDWYRIEQANDLREVLVRLRPPDRELILEALSGSSHRTIAERFGWSIGEVGTRLRRATARASAVWSVVSLPLASGMSMGVS